MIVTATGRRRTFATVGVSARQEALLLARIQAGDGDALGAVYDQHAGLVYGLARRVTRDEQLARDITQEVFTYLWELPGRVDLTRGSLRSYLAMVAHRRAVDEVRRHERRTRTEAASARPEAEEGPEPEVVAATTASWRKTRLAAMLDRLPAEQREAVQLAYYRGQTYTQVAKTLGIPEGTAKSRLRLALARLRTLLDDETRAAIR